MDHVRIPTECGQDADGIPPRFPTNIADRLYYCMRGVNTGYFHMILSLNGRIDEQRLAKAARLAADAEPLLGCQFIDHWLFPYWQRRNDLEETEFLKMVPVRELKTDLNRVTGEFSDPRVDLQFKVFVLRSNTDTLCIRMNHMIGDGSAGKDLIYLLASIYGRIGEDPDFYPKPKLGVDRSYKRLGQQLKLKDKLAIFKNLRWPMREIKKAGVTWQPPAHSTGSERHDSVNLVLPPERTQAIRRYARKHRSSPNLVLITAFFRALESVIPHPPNSPLPIIMTIDLRRYLPSRKTDVMCNHSGAEALFIHSKPGMQFSEILSQVLEQYKRLKKNYLGLSSILLILETFPLFKTVRFLPFHLIKKAFASKVNPMSGVSSAAGLTNWGEIDPEKGRFGNTEITSAYGTTHLFQVPGVIVIAATYFNGTATFNMHYLEKWLPGNIVRDILDRMDRELRL